MSLTQTKKHTKIGLTFFIAVIALALFVVPQTVFANTYISPSQNVYPQACIPIVSRTFRGETVYRVSEGCGKLVVTGVTGSTVPVINGGISTSPYASQSTAALDILYGKKPTYLETNPTLQPKTGYLLVAQQSSRYSFYLTGDNRATASRSMVISAVGRDVVFVRFWPGQEQYALQVGSRVNLDLTGDGTVDVKLRLLQIGSDGVVLLHVAFPPQPASVIARAAEDKYAFFASVTAFTAVALLIYHFVNHIYLRRHALPPKEWWSVHAHEPFGPHNR